MRTKIIAFALPICIATHAQAAAPECQAAFGEATSLAGSYALSMWATDEALNRSPSNMPRKVFELAFEGAGYSPDQAIVQADAALKSTAELKDKDPMGIYLREVVETKKFPPNVTERILLEQESKFLDELNVGLAKLRIACGTGE